ncbi:MAG: tetratricopeptide repeat protein [Isosphaeraceae bacterium]
MANNRFGARRLAAALLALLVLGGGVWLAWRLRNRGGSENTRSPGIAAYDAKDWPAAEKAARDRLRTHRDDREAQQLLARALIRQGRDQAGLTIQLRLPDPMLSAEDYFLRGQAALRMGRKEHAILAWRQALGKDNDHVETLVALEQTFLRLDLLNEAARSAERLAKVPGWEARGALMLGRIRAEQLDPAGAAEALVAALDRPDEWHGSDDRDRVRKQLARMLLRTGKPGRAREALGRLEKPAVDDPEACWLLSRCDLQQGRTMPPSIALAAHGYRDQHPIEPEPSPFVGEASCRECHEPIYRSQHHSRHARTFFRGDQLAMLELPARPVADPDDRTVAHAFDRGDGKPKLQTRVGGRVFQTVVDYAFGSGDRGLTLVGHDADGRPYEFRLSRYSDPPGWDVTSGQPRGTGQAELYQGMRITADAVRRCLFCHTTDARSIVTGKGPEAADAAIGCERCHGPAGNHLLALKAHAEDLAIARPRLASGTAVVKLCSQCHSPRDPELPMIPGSDESVRFQGTTLTWSRCYTESHDALGCVNCHDPHRDAETRESRYEARCLDCHGASRSKPGEPRSAAHAPRESHAEAASCPVNPEKGCIACHMPRVRIPMTHASFTDHYIRVHREGAAGSAAAGR